MSSKTPSTSLKLGTSTLPAVTTPLAPAVTAASTHSSLTLTSSGGATTQASLTTAVT